MFYVITAVLLILVIALIFIFRAPKMEKPEEETEQPAVIIPETEAAAEKEEPVSIEEKTEEEHEAGEEVPVEEELGLEMDVVEGASVEKESGQDEEYTELSFEMEETEVEGKEPHHGEEYDELSLDAEEPPEEPSVEPPGETAPVAEDDGEKLDVAPALAGAMEESVIAEEAPPEELVDKLNSYFGEDEAPLHEEVEAEEVEDEPAEKEDAVAEEEPEVVQEAVPEEEHAELPPAEPEVAAGLTLEIHAENLRNLEDRLRREHAAVTEKEEADKRTVLEQKLQHVCEKQAGLEGSFHLQLQLIDTTLKLLEKVQGESDQKDLPGVDIDEAARQLQRGQYQEVESMLAEASLQLDHESALYADLYYQCGRLAEERLDFESAFEDYRNAAAAENNISSHLLAAGRMARILGNDQDAQAWLERLVSDDEGEGQTVEQASARHELALVYVRTDRKDKAGDLFKRSLDIGEAVLSAGHPERGPVMHDYAVLLESNGMYEQAEEYYLKALEVMGRSGYGADHPRLGSTLNRLAGLYEELEFEDKAEPLYERALAIKERVLGKEHHDVGAILSNLAELLRRQDKLEQAEPLFKRSLEISEKELGKDHPNLAVVLNNMAELYSQMGREEEASLYQKRAFSLFELPGLNGDFVEMEKDELDIEDDRKQKITGD
jgi:tetratricopeptide (TPR) repeat protein